MIRILIVDDHPLLREGVASMIQLETDMVVVGEAGNGEEAIARFRELTPDVTLIDLEMPGMNGVQAVRAIRSEFADARIIALTTYTSDALLFQALKEGAAAYLLKSTLRVELLDTIRAAYSKAPPGAP